MPAYKEKHKTIMHKLPKKTIKKLDAKAPIKPNKFVTSLPEPIFPNPGSAGLWVKMLKIKKEEKSIKVKPIKNLNKNNLKLPYLNIINNINCNTFRIR